MTTATVAVIELLRQSLTVEGQAQIRRLLRLLRGPAGMPLGAFVAGAATGAAVAAAATYWLGCESASATRAQLSKRLRTLLKRGNGVSAPMGQASRRIDQPNPIPTQ